MPALRELVEIVEMAGCMVVAGALHCQRETARAIVEQGADYLLNVKDNQGTLTIALAVFLFDILLCKCYSISQFLGRISWFRWLRDITKEGNNK